MKRRLTKQDIKKLKYSTRTGYVFGLFVFLPVIGFYIFSVVDQSENRYDSVLAVGLLISILIVWLVNRKYWIDLRNQEKDIVIKMVDKKETKEEFLGGSSTGISVSGKKGHFYTGMRSRMEYSFIIDYVRHRVDKDVWDNVKENEEVEFHVAMKSQQLLSIKAKDKL